MNAAEKEHKKLMEAVTSYIGQPIEVWDGKKWEHVGTVTRGGQSKALKSLEKTFAFLQQ